MLMVGPGCSINQGSGRSHRKDQMGQRFKGDEEVSYVSNCWKSTQTEETVKLLTFSRKETGVAVEK